MSIEGDVAIVGAGPAGLAAAIALRLRGCRVIVLEKSKFPRHRPGETHHPGLGALLRELGVEDDVSRLSRVRHRGVWVNWKSEPRFEAYGRDELGPWRGYQIRRSSFDSLLLRRARQLGVQVIQPCGRTEVSQLGGRATGVFCNQCEVKARFVIDASGGQHWLQRQLGLRLLRFSPRLVATYGYVTASTHSQFCCPSIKAEGETWTWIAQIDTDLYHWTRLSLNSEVDRKIPMLFRGVSVNRGPYGADVSWRAVEPAAGKGFFLVGEAAAVLDPIASHGVLRSLMSGIQVGDLIAQVLNGSQTEENAQAFYQEWLMAWVASDIHAVKGLYQMMGTHLDWLH